MNQDRFEVALQNESISLSSLEVVFKVASDYDVQSLEMRAQGKAFFSLKCLHKNIFNL